MVQTYLINLYSTQIAQLCFNIYENYYQNLPVHLTNLILFLCVYSEILRYIIKFKCKKFKFVIKNLENIKYIEYSIILENCSFI